MNRETQPDCQDRAAEVVENVEDDVFMDDEYYAAPATTKIKVSKPIRKRAYVKPFFVLISKTEFLSTTQLLEMERVASEMPEPQFVILPEQDWLPEEECKQNSAPTRHTCSKMYRHQIPEAPIPKPRVLKRSKVLAAKVCKQW